MTEAMAEVTLLRQKAADGTLTVEEQRAWIQKVREGRFRAATLGSEKKSSRKGAPAVDAESVLSSL